MEIMLLNTQTRLSRNCYNPIRLTAPLWQLGLFLLAQANQQIPSTLRVNSCPGSFSASSRLPQLAGHALAPATGRAWLLPLMIPTPLGVLISLRPVSSVHWCAQTGLKTCDRPQINRCRDPSTLIPTNSDAWLMWELKALPNSECVLHLA